MPGPNLSTCSPWSTIDDLCVPCSTNYDTIDPDLIDRMLQIASDTLFIKSGRQFPGECTTTVRPCRQTIHYNPPPRLYSSDNTYYNFCGCSAPSSCGCPHPSQITLGVEPLVSVEEVKVDGVVLDPSLYRIDDYRYLVRLRDPDGSYQTWKCCQDILLPDTEPDTVSVTFTYGRNPPPGGVHAAAVLACELILSCNPIDGAECRLPRRVVSLNRQGVSMVLTDPTQLLSIGRYGITEVDDFLATWNPNNLRRPSTVISPDIGKQVRRVGT